MDPFSPWSAEGGGTDVEGGQRREGAPRVGQDLLQDGWQPPPEEDVVQEADWGRPGRDIDEMDRNRMKPNTKTLGIMVLNREGGSVGKIYCWEKIIS
jgi:hypothetical protein